MSKKSQKTQLDDLIRENFQQNGPMLFQRNFGKINCECENCQKQVVILCDLITDTYLKMPTSVRDSLGIAALFTDETQGAVIASVGWLIDFFMSLPSSAIKPCEQCGWEPQRSSEAAP